MDFVCFAIVISPIQAVHCFEPELLLPGTTNVQRCLKANIKLKFSCQTRKLLDASQSNRRPSVSENCSSTTRKSKRISALQRIALMSFYRRIELNDATVKTGRIASTEINSILASPLRFLRLLDHLVRSRQHIWRNRQADLLGGFEIDHKLKFGRLFDGNVGWLSTLENLVHLAGGAASSSFFLLCDHEILCYVPVP
jgi:hypothetical protein